MTIFSTNTGSFERVTVNDTTNATSYLDGAMTVAGGMSIQKDLRISGSMTINGLLTVVSMSSQYVTSSQYNVGVSKITVNDDDNVRFAGFSVFDSGSSSPATASIFWDSLNHKFLYENLSGSSYNSAILIAGPKNTDSLGNETGLTSGYIPYATGDDHIDNSVMFQSSSNIGIGTSTPGYKLDVYTVGGSSATTRLYGNDQTNVRLRLENIGSGGRTWELIGGLPGANNSNLSIYDATGTSTRLTIDSSGNIGVSTTNPATLLHLGGANNKSIRIDSSTSNSGFFGTYQNETLISANRNPSTGTITDATKAVATIKLNSNVSDGNITFWTTGTNNVEAIQRVIIDANGNVGIGTTNPGAPLSVQSDATYDGEVGAIRLQTATDTNKRLYLGYDKNLNAGYVQAQQAGTNWQSLLLNPNGGNVGIGTTNPAFGLAVEKDQGSGYIASFRANNTSPFITIQTTSGITQIQGLNSAASAVNNISMQLSGGNVGIGTAGPDAKLRVQASTQGIFVASNSATPAASTMFQVNSEGNTSSTYIAQFGSLNDGIRVVMRSDGNVGIGTTNAVSKLTITDGVAPYAAATGEMLQIKRNTTNGTDAAQTRITLANNSNGFSLAYGGTSDRLRFLDGGAVEVMSMVNGGNVGIGTTNPTSLWSGDAKVLHVSASGTTAAGVRVASSRANVEFYSSGTTDNWGFYTTANMPFSLYTNNVERIRVTGDGNVGIGTTNPATLLHLNAAIGIPNARYLNFYTGEIGSSGFGKAIAISYSDNTATSQPKQIGLILHNNSNTNNTFSPAIVFGNYSDSGNYSAANAMIAGRRLSQQGDVNWHAGELWFWTATNNTVGGIPQGIPDGYPVMVMSANRSVGINTTSPTSGYILDARGGVVIKRSQGYGSYASTQTAANTEVFLKLESTLEGGSRMDLGNYVTSLASIQAITHDVGGGSYNDGSLSFWTALDASLSEKMRIMYNGNVGIGVTTTGYKLEVNGSTRITSGFHSNYDGTNENGYFYVGKDWSATNHRINRQVTQGGVVLVVSAYGASGVNSDTAIFYSVNNYDANGAASALILGRNSSTSRSINAGGTINASGADYAEYMTKNGDFTLHKGDICGVDVNGELTNKYSEAHSFVVKSTDPSYVGGDTWGNDNAIGEKPYLTRQGDEETDEAYAERVAQYEIDMELYNTALEDARKLVDRIAFSGQVPVNVVGASVGDYIIPSEGAGDTIVGVAVTSPTFEQYQMAVGKVWKILEDGRAFISVKIG